MRPADALLRPLCLSLLCLGLILPGVATPAALPPAEAAESRAPVEIYGMAGPHNNDIEVRHSLEPPR